MLLITLISLLSFVPVHGTEVSDTLTGAVVESSMKQVLDMERLASPVSVVYLNDLENRGITSPKDLSAMIPNLHIPDYGSSMTSTVYLRGFGSRMENPVMGLYVDDVPVLNKNAYDIDMLDIRRADMLRGPQGTLYGRNSMCGVLSLSTLSPSSYSGVRAALHYGTANSVSARVAAYGKNRKGLAIGGGVSFRRGDGYYPNVHKGEMCDPYNAFSVRLRAEKDLKSDLHFENILSAGVIRQGGWPYRQLDVEKGELHPVAYNDTCAYRRFNLMEAVKFKLDSDRFTINSVSALQLLFDRMDMDQDFTARSMFTLAQIQREGALTQEIILRPKAEWKKSWWDWQSGVFAFFKYNRMSAPVNFKHDGINDLILGNANANIPEDVSGGMSAPLAIKEDAFPISSEFGLGAAGAAFYHESYFTFGNWLLTAGLRLDYEGNLMDYHSDATVHYMFRPTMKDWKPFATVYEGRLDNHYVELLPKFSAVYDCGDLGGKGDLKAFGVISKGYRSGGFNTQIFSDILQNMMMNGMMADLGVYLDGSDNGVTAEKTAYKPEKSWNFEVGGRLNLAENGHRFEGAASLFWITCRDQQITLFPPGKSTGRMMANVGLSRSIGAEMTMMYSFKGLSASLAYGYTDARFTEYNDGNSDYSGNRIPYSPEHTMNTRAGYDFRFNSGAVRGLSLNADCSLVGRIWWDEANRLVEPCAILLGGDMVLDLNWADLRLRVDNLTGYEYNVFYFKSIGNSFFQCGKPLRWTVGLTFEL